MTLEPAQAPGPGNREVRVWMDGSFDMVHPEHVLAIYKARQFGDKLIVGVQPDSDIQRVKGPPVFTEDERCRLIRAIKGVDQVVEAAPYGTSVDTLDKYACDFCVHGDDPTIAANKDDPLHKLSAVNKIKFFKRGYGMSTTDIINRILVLSRDNASWHERDRGQYAHVMTASRILAAGTKKPSPGDKIVYTAGAFDLFHVGHLDFLEKAAALGDYLIVGIYPDHVVNQREGSFYPVLTMVDRAYRVLACKFVSDVVFEAAVTVSAKFMDNFEVDVVCVGETAPQPKEPHPDPYAVPKERNKFVAISSGSHVKSHMIVERITSKRVQYEARNKKKLESEKKAEEYVTSSRRQ